MATDTTENLPMSASGDPLDTTPERQAAYWIAELNKATTVFKDWQVRCDDINKRYRDERNRAQDQIFTKKFNVLWSNVQTIKPAIYAKPPKPVIERRFLERNAVEKVAGQTLERAVLVEIETTDFDPAHDRAVLDYLLGGRGQVWIRYVAQIDDPEEDFVENLTNAQDDDERSEQVEQSETRLPVVTSEHLAVDFVHRRDFLHDPARTWEEVRWVAKRSWLTRKATIEAFGKDTADKVAYVDMNAESQVKDDRDSKPVEKRAEFWEVWDRTRRKVWYINPGYGDKPCKVEDDPLHLKQFWPCPKPLYATLTNDTLIPVPDYDEYRSQAEQLDQLAQRIYRLTTAIKAVGVYDASIPELARMLQEGSDNKLIASESMAVFGQKGGFEGTLQLLPIESMAKTLVQLVEQFEMQKQQLYEITGISDILRGQGAASETATAQRIKGQFGTMRLRDRQEDVARFCRDSVRIMTELISEHFAPETIIAMTSMDCPTAQEKAQAQMQLQAMQQSSIQMPPSNGSPSAPAGGGVPQAGLPAPPPPMGHNGGPPLQDLQELIDKPTQEEVFAFLRDDRLRGFRIDIETDSTIEADYQTEKEDVKEFLQGFAAFIGSVAEPAQAFPGLMPVLGEMILFAARRFKAGRQLETTLTNFVDKLEKIAKNPPPAKPDPEMIKAQTAKEEMLAKQKMEQEKAQREEALQAQKDQRQAQLEQANDQRAAQINEQEMAQKREEHQLNMQQQREQHEFKMQELMVKAQHDARAQERDEEKHRIELEKPEREREERHKDRQLEWKLKNSEKNPDNEMVDYDDKPSETAKALTEVMKAIQDISKAHGETTEQLIKAFTAKRKMTKNIVRDPKTGRAIALEQTLE